MNRSSRGGSTLLSFTYFFLPKVLAAASVNAAGQCGESAQLCAAHGLMLAIFASARELAAEQLDPLPLRRRRVGVARRAAGRERAACADAESWRSRVACTVDPLPTNSWRSAARDIPSYSSPKARSASAKRPWPR